MKIIKMKCPNCGAELLVDKDKKWAVCEHCREKFYLDDEKRPTPFININFWGKRETKRDSTAALVGIIFSLVLIFMLMIGRFFIDNLINNVETIEYTYREKPESFVMREFAQKVFGKDYANIDQSEYASIKYICIDKDDNYSESGESVWLIKYSDKIDVSGMPEDLRTVTVEGSEELQLRDLQVFTGLEEIIVEENCYVAWDLMGNGDYDFRNLSNLKRISIQNKSVSYIKDAFEKPEIIEKLEASIFSEEDIEILTQFKGIKSFIFSLGSKDIVKNLDFLTVFTKLEEAKFYFGDDSWDLSPIAALTGLKRLSISGNEKLKGISVLYGMPKLEELKLKNLPQIKDLGFVNSMPNLFMLSLECCGVDDISAVRDNFVIQELEFINCNKLYDVSAISGVQNLKKLAFKTYNNNLIGESLSNLKLLDEVLIDSQLLGILEGNTAISKLSVDISGEKFFSEPISSMVNLEEINFLNNSIKSDQEKLLFIISKLPKLKKVKGIDYTFYDSSIEELDLSILFASNSIEEIIFPMDGDIENDSAFEISLSNMQDNTVLRKLDIRHCHIRNIDEAGERPYFIADLPELRNYANSFLSRFKAMEEICVADCGLDDLEFVRSMPELRVIDLSDNSVSDISPLLDCKKLEKVICTNNGLVNTSILPEDVVVIGN